MLMRQLDGKTSKTSADCQSDHAGSPSIQAGRVE